jgi:hypothetical protein
MLWHDYESRHFEDEYLPTAYGGCTCDCHRTPHVMHCVPCCYPTDDDLVAKGEVEN